MPTHSRVDIGFAFSTPTGRKVRSRRKKLHALIRAIETDGEANDIDGVHITARWRNPEDKAARSQAWKDTDGDSDLEEFFSTMSGLTSMLIDVNKLRLEYEQTFSRTSKVRRKKAAKKSGRGKKTIRKVAGRKGRK